MTRPLPFIPCAAGSLCGDRNEQQDRTLTLSLRDRSGLLLAVADGMGGLPCGGWAAETVLEALARSVLAQRNAAHHPAATLQKAIADAQETLLCLNREAGIWSGTTIAAVLITRRWIAMAHVGDSRIYAFRGPHLLYRSQDHSEVGEMVRMGLLSRVEATAHPRRNILRHCLGLDRPVEPRIALWPRALVGRLLLASDGVWTAWDRGSLDPGCPPPGGLQETLHRAVAVAGPGADNASLVEADLAPGRTRRAMARPRPGTREAPFWLRPLDRLIGLYRRLFAEPTGWQPSRD